MTSKQDQGTSLTATAARDTVLERLTVNLIPRAQVAIARSIGRTGDNKTDTINRLVLVGEDIEALLERGGTVFFQEPGESGPVRLKILL